MDQLPPAPAPKRELSTRGGWLLALLLLPACSPRTTTPQSRLWQGFITRYNTLYHAREAYRETYQTALTTTEEDYSSRLPFDPLTTLLQEGKERPNFSRTLSKTRKAIAEHSMLQKPARQRGWRQDPRARALQAKTEYNPVLHQAWLLQTQALFYSGQLEEARLTAEGLIQRYASEPLVREQARLWAVRALTMLGRTGEAEELLRLLPLDPTTEALRQSYLYPATRAELALAQEHLQEALPPLRQAIRLAPDRSQRARLHYLLAQLLLQLGSRQEAEQSFLRAQRLTHSPQLELAARLATLSLQGEDARGEKLLLRLAQQRRYAPYQAEIFLALGQSYLRRGERQLAEGAWLRAIDSARSHHIPWALAQLAWGDLALASQRYPEAQQAYAQAVSALPPKHPRLTELQRLLPELTRLAPWVTEVRRGDSLLRLALLPEALRLKHIDSLIREVRRRQSRAASPEQAPLPSTPPTGEGAGEGSFYFDRPELVVAGRRRFLSYWGDRPLTDDWNRTRRALPATPIPSLPEELAGEPSPEQAPERTDSLSRAFYLRDLPLTASAQAQVREQTAGALLQQANLLAERLERLEDAARSYTRLLREFPAFTQREEATYKALLLALRRGRRSEADSLRTLLLTAYPQSSRTAPLRSADYVTALSQQAVLPARLYAEAWEAYRQGALSRLDSKLDSLRPLLLPEELEDKVHLLRLLRGAQLGQEASLLTELRALKRQHPQSELLPYIEALEAGLAQGKRFIGLPLTTSPLSSSAPATDSLPPPPPSFLPLAPSEVPELLLLYPRGSQPAHEVYFTLMSFTFTHFTQWSLEALPWEGFTAWGGFRIRGFRQASDRSSYLARAEGADGLLPSLPAGTLLLPLAPANLPLLSDQTLPAYLQHLSTSPRP